MLANSSKYAVKAIVYLVNNSAQDEKKLAIEVAKCAEVPKPFISKLLRQLSSKKLISSSKGPNGGFYISEDQLKGSLLDIIVEVEGKDRLSQCALNFENCNEEKPCPVHHLIALEKASLHNKFKGILLKDLIE